MILFSSIYPLVFYDVMGGLVEKFSSISPELMHQIDNTKQELIFFFVKWQSIISILIFMACIFFSHKIAGPIYKIRKHLNQLIEEGQWSPIYLRNGDYFPELAEDVNKVLKSSGKKSGNGLSSIEDVNIHLKKISANSPQDKKDALDEVIKKLTELQKRFDA
ncbi:MAG: hypothetical protein OXB84_00695 [Halobacteriovoraceae bacterium]|nr:hypothetical protein [Halobacteriovoraceae bacterium]